MRIFIAILICEKNNLICKDNVMMNGIHELEEFFKSAFKTIEKIKRETKTEKKNLRQKLFLITSLILITVLSSAYYIVFTFE